ncbi:MAG: hypothetical protein ACLSX5_06090 [Lachnospiraceae bacterium]
MMDVKKSIVRLQNRFDKTAERFAFRHPYGAFLAMFVGVPLFALLAVSISTVCVTLPIAWIFGWL